MLFSTNCNAKLSANGQKIEIANTSPFMETCQKLAQDTGINNFTVLVDGSEIDKVDIPATFIGISKVEIIEFAS